MALQIDGQWNLKLFSNSYTTWQRVYQGDLVVFEEHHFIPPEVMKQIVNDHNALIEAKALLARARDLIDDFDETVRMHLAEGQTDWQDDYDHIEKFYHDLEKIHLAD